MCSGTTSRFAEKKQGQSPLCRSAQRVRAVVHRLEAICGTAALLRKGCDRSAKQRDSQLANGNRCPLFLPRTVAMSEIEELNRQVDLCRIVVGDSRGSDSKDGRSIRRHLVIGLRGQCIRFVGPVRVDAVQTAPLFDGFAMVVEVDDGILSTMNQHHSRVFTLVGLFELQIKACGARFASTFCPCLSVFLVAKTYREHLFGLLHPVLRTLV